ncbi:MAG: Ni/Fe-hydrogenase cytochrome b subunit [Chloroflexi bacterium]|nr:Ni/Fe-hydrogenase cytochrome b subunit [Chloroflexota bacterium]
MMPETSERRRFPIGTLVLSIIAILGLGVIIYRYLNGIGAISDLSDGRAWGLWISFDLYCGVALAAGGFTLAGAVYIFGLKKYYPVVRPAILTAFLGYTLVILALLVDLGQPWYIWHALIYWNIHSPLFEVAICVMTYTIVLALEFSPVVFERLNWKVPLRAIRAIQIPLVIAGIVLSTLHQSSLGSMVLMMPETLDPLWYTPILPLLFLVSAIAVGPAMVIFESMLSSKAFGHRLSTDILSGLGRAIPYILGIYLVLKIGDLIVSKQLGLIFSDDPRTILWWAEIIFGVVLPIVFLSRASVRQNRSKLFLCVLLVVGGLILNRFDVSWLALAGREGYTYFPDWMEFAVSAGLVAWAMIIMMLANSLLPMHHHEEVVEEESQPPEEAAKPALTGMTGT